MIDPELQSYLSGINQHLVEIKAKKSPGIWRAFFNGMFSALGYVIGLVLVIVILGWILSATGLLKPLQGEWQRFQTFIDKAEGLMNSESPPPAAATQSQDGIYTLPNGQKVQVVPVQ